MSDTTTNTTTTTTVVPIFSRIKVGEIDSATGKVNLDETLKVQDVAPVLEDAIQQIQALQQQVQQLKSAVDKSTEKL